MATGPCSLACKHSTNIRQQKPEGRTSLSLKIYALNSMAIESPFALSESPIGSGAPFPLPESDPSPDPSLATGLLWAKNKILIAIASPAWSKTTMMSSTLLVFLSVAEMTGYLPSC